MKFFHKIANSHRRNNNIEMLKIEGVECREEEAIKDHVVNFFEELLTEQVGWRPTLNGLVFGTIELEEVERMEMAFEEEEVYDVIKKMAKNKAPGPDGFSMGFYQECWEVIKGDLMKVF